MTGRDPLALLVTAVGEAGLALQAAGNALGALAAVYQEAIAADAPAASTSAPGAPGAPGDTTGDTTSETMAPAPTVTSRASGSRWEPQEFTTLGARRSERPEPPSSPTA